MSKKSKVSSKKTASKSKAKKQVKKASKPAPKKKAEKKPSKVVSKKKHLVKKVSKPAKPIKKTVAKKSAPAKKLKAKAPVKPVKKAKAVAKKPVVTKTKVLPAKKQTSKAIVKKAAAPATAKVIASKPVIAKPVAHKVTEKKATEKPVKEVQSVFKKAEKKTPEVMAVQNTLPAKKKDEISPSKIASISHSITNPIKRVDSYSVKPEKEPAGKFEMEFVIHASSEMLYEFLSSPSGLSEWFCDDLNIRNGIYTFIWEDQLMQARLLKTSELQLVRFQWVEKTDGSYFEFRIQKDDLTNDISLIITDFAETAGDRESAKLLWQSQIEKLRHKIGSIF